ncbi:MAG: hypothetical protein AAFS10_17915 [Myxococcota bacterium]
MKTHKPMVGLSILQWASRALAKRLRAKVRRYCTQRQTSPAELVTLSRRLGGRWFFFQALWVGDVEEAFVVQEA